MTDPPCINLMDRFGDRYRICFDEAYDPKGKHHLDPCYMQLKGAERGVWIYPHGHDTLALECDYHPGIAKKVAALPGVTLSQDGDHEKTFLFDIGLFDQVADIVKPRKKRVLSDEHKAKLAEATKPYRFGATPVTSTQIEGPLATEPPEAGIGPS